MNLVHLLPARYAEGEQLVGVLSRQGQNPAAEALLDELHIARINMKALTRDTPFAARSRMQSILARLTRAVEAAYAALPITPPPTKTAAAIVPLRPPRRTKPHAPRTVKIAPVPVSPPPTHRIVRLVWRSFRVEAA